MSNVFQRVPSLRAALHQVIVHLRMAAKGCLLIAVTGEGENGERLRREVQAAVVEQFYDQSTFDEHVFDPLYSSLAAYLETLPPPRGEKRPITFVAGLEALPADKQEQAIRLLNMERDALQNSRRSILLWVTPPTVPALIHQAGDFWAWRSGVIEFQLPPGTEFRPGPTARLPVRELARLYRFKDAYEGQLASAPPSTPATADLKLQLADVYRQLGFPERQVMALRREGLALKAQTGDEETQVQAYNQFVVDRYGRLTLYSLKADAPLSVELEKVYVTLTAVERVRRQSPISDRQSGVAPEEVEEEREITVERTLSVSEALSESSRLVIVGAPGCGKTTLLQWLALTYARDAAQERLKLAESRVPVFVPLRAFGKHLESHPDRSDLNPTCLLDFMEEHFAGWQLNLPPGFFARLAEEGRCAFLFDGLDEVADPGRRADVARAVQAFVARYPGNRFAVTSRPAGYTGLARLGPDFTRCDVRPFSDDDVEQFVTNWYLTVETVAEDNPATRQKAAENSADLLGRIRENDRIRRLVDTPLLLTVVALVHQNRTTLPHRRAELYDECTQMLLGFWDEQKGGEAARELAQLGELDRYEKRAILEPIALRFHEQREAQEVEGEDLRRWLREEFAAIGDPQPQRRAALFLRVIQERAGLLVESDADTYRFSHLTFQEYLAARAVADREDYVAYTLERRHDPWWREVILLEAGHLSTPRSKRARKLTTDLVRAIWKANERIGEPVLSAAEGSANRRVSESARRRSSDEDDLEWAVERLLRRDLLLAGCCLADLGPIGVEEEVRDGIVAELGETLRTTRYSKLREETARVLTGMGGSGSAARAEEELIAALAADDSRHVREAAARGLGQLGQASSEVVATLTQALAADDSWPVREAAASGLGQLGQASPEVVAALIGALADDDSRVREAAASGLVQLGQVSPAVVQALFQALADADSWRVCQAAASSLVQLGQTSPDVVQALFQALAADEWRVRQTAASGLGQLGQTSPEVVQALIAALADDDYNVRQAAASGLGQLGQASPDVVQALTNAFANDNSPSVRHAAASSLGQISPDTIQTLTNALASDDLGVCKAAAFGLGELGQTTPDVVQPLIHALINGHLTVRRAAAFSLGRLGHASPDIVQALTDAFTNDDSLSVRHAAASTLVHLGQAGPDFVQTLTNALADEDGRVRQAAASSLIQFGHASPDVVQALIHALADDDCGVRQTAASGLAQLGQAGPEVIALLIQALAYADWSVQEAASSSLVQLAASDRDLVLRALLPTFTDPAFEKPCLLGRPAYDHAFDALWAIAGISGL